MIGDGIDVGRTLIGTITMLEWPRTG
jgi:hypothetical protein